MTKKQYKEVPPYNDKFSFQKFLHVIKISLPIIFLIFVLSILGGYLYLRYTQPLYQAYSIIQINKNEETSKILETVDNLNNNNNNENDLPHTIEILRSKEFLKRVFNKLPLKIAYFREGTFLREEIYKSSPFAIEIKKFNYYNTPIYITFTNPTKATISFQQGKKNITKEITIGKWQSPVADMQIKVTIKNYKQIQDNYNSLKSNKYLFIVYDDKTLFKKHYQNLQITIENNLAKTIRIQYTGNNPTKVADMVNTIAEEFLKYDVETKKESTKKILEFIEKQSMLVYEKLNYLDKKLKKYEKANTYSQMTDISLVYIEKVNDLQDRKTELQYEVTTLKNILSKINKDNTNTYEILGLLSGLDIESTLLTSLNTLQQLIDEKEELLNNLQPNNLKVKSITKKIEKQKELIKALLQSLIKHKQSEIQKITKKIIQYNAKLNTKKTNEIEHSRLARLYKINEEYYNNLLKKKTEYLIYQAGSISNNTILEKASVPSAPILPKKDLVIISTILIAFILSLLYIIIRYLLYNTIISTEDITDYTDVPIIGNIPHTNDSSNQVLKVDPKSKTHITEAFRQLRTNIEFFNIQKEKKIIAITSTISGEGKTFVSINLSAIIAGFGKKVILIDLDLRKPQVHKNFSYDNQKGISSILINKHSITECIIHDTKGNFDFIPAGPQPPNPTELISSPQMNKLINYLSENYDIVVFDTPPIGLVIDALPVYKNADLKLYVVRQAYSKRTFINNINRLKYDMQIQNLAIVFNNIKYSHNGNYYGYGYGYGYNYGYYYGENKKNNSK